MKLELKHLAAYLPYKLKCQFVHSGKIGTISNIYTIGEGYNNDDIKISIDFSDGEHIWMFKPILRPLSDLTKEIEVNGENFVPNYNSDFKYFTPYELSYFIESIPHGLNYNQMQKLLEWHFDIFGLIDNGLAIDINTIK